MPATQKPLTGKKLDAAIAAAYKIAGDRVEIPLSAIPRIYRDARAAYAAGETDLIAVLAGIIAQVRV